MIPLTLQGRGSGQFNRLFPSDIQDCGKRDFQRSKVYRAEYKVEADAPFFIQCSPAEFIDGAIFSFLSNLSDDLVIRKAFGRNNILIDVVHSKTQCSRAHNGEVRLCVRDNGISAYEILHEIAHILMRDALPHHGICFTSIFLFLVKRALPEKHYQAHLSQYKKQNIKFLILTEEDVG